MRISLFGSLADAIGREVTVPVPDGATARDVRQALIDRYPDAERLLGRRGVRACVDEVIVDEDAPVPDGAEVAFFPPVSGG